MSNRLDRVLSVLLTAAAVTMAVVLVWKQVSASGTTKAPGLERIKEWDQVISTGTRIGSERAAIQIAEFSDFQCPFCKRFHGQFKKLQAELGEDVALVFVHFPLPSHKMALPAARAAECAGAQGRFPEYTDLLFAKQDSIGKKKWESFAHDAGVADTAAFSRCASDTVEVKKAVRGLELGDRMRVSGTPTVMVNGWRFPQPPSDSLLLSVIAALRAGKKPRI